MNYKFTPTLSHFGLRYLVNSDLCFVQELSQQQFYISHVSRKLVEFKSMSKNLLFIYILLLMKMKNVKFDP